MKKRKTWVALLVTMLAVAALVIALPFGRAFVIKNNGIELAPGGEIPAREVKAFLQNDAAWAQDTLGASSFRMGGHGCLVCCVASAMCDLGLETDPGALNQLLYEKGVYTQEGDIIWDSLKALGLSYDYNNDFDASTLEKHLQNGLLPMVKVKYKGKGAFHWVLVTGSNQEDFLVLDSLHTAKEPIPLKTHGRVYAYRVLYKG